MSENYAFRMKDESLSHHGIEGQKWGVRNGPPYPLDSGKHSAAEKRAMKKESKQVYKEVKSLRENNKSVIDGEKVKEKLEDLRNNVPQINEYIEAYRAYMDLPNSKEGRAAIEKVAKRAFEEEYGKKWEENDRSAARWLDTFTSEPDIYYPALINSDQNLKNAYQALTNMRGMLQPVYAQASQDILGKYSDKKIDGRNASDILAKSMEYYFT